MTKRTELSPLQRFQRLLQVDKRHIYQVYIYAFFNGLVNLSLPLGIQAIINLIQGGEVSSAWIVLVSLVIIGIAITGVLQLMQLRIVENISQNIFTRASFEFAYRIPRIKFKELYNYYAPELANRFFDTLTIQKGLPKILIDFSLSAFQIIAGLIVLSMYHPFFILFGVALVAMVYTILSFTGPKGMKTSLQESKYKYSIAYWLEEIARTKTSFKLVANQDIALKQTDERVSKYLEARESHFKILVLQFIQLIGFKVLVAAGLLVIGGLLVFEQEMNIGQFVAAEIIIILIISSVEKLINSLESIYDVLTALEKIGYVTDMDLDNDAGIKLEKSIKSYSITLQDVCFSFPDSNKLILKDIDLHIPTGKSVRIIGPSGSGKSTLMQILSGVYEPTEGTVRYSDLALQSLCMVTLRKNIGFCLSNNQVFLGNLLNNIAMGREGVTIETVLWAINLVNLQDFVASLPMGLETDIDPEGMRLPRSVTNKILLARCIVTKPSLLLLEDPLDHVPNDEKEMIIERLVGYTGWSIALTTVDAIWTKYIQNEIVLKDGKIDSINFE
jgi:ABC-type bacteriocin/lantibiotic exporter with double-glycine peptidase domain